MPGNTNMESPSDPAGGGVDWEARYLAGDTPWDKGGAHPGLLAWLASHRMAGRVLVPGCGAGHDVRAIAATGADVTGFDIAPSALRAASAQAPVGSEVYRLGDFLAGEAGGGFDWLFEHTCFCAIDPARRADYAWAAASAVKPGGHLLAIFYRNPDHPDGPPFGCTDAELDALFTPHFETLASETGFPTYPGREHRELLRLFRRSLGQGGNSTSSVIER